MTSVNALPLDSGFYLSAFDIGAGNVPANTPAVGGWAVDGTYAYMKVVSGTIGSGAYSIAGRAYTSQGAAFATFETPGSTSRPIAGISHTAEGAIHVTTDAPAYSIGGLPVSATGALCVGMSQTSTANDYDGTNDYASRGADLTNIADGKAGTISWWGRIDGGNGSFMVMMASAPVAAKVALFRNTTGTIGVVGRNAAGGTILSMVSTTTHVAGSAWINVLASWDLAAATGHLYVNDVNVKSGTQTLTDDTIDYTNGNFVLGAASDGTFKYNGCMAHPFFHTTAINLSVTANRRKFITASGKPAQLGSDGSLPLGVQPLYYDLAADGTNIGSGGNLTVTGALTACSTAP